jgi:tRNA G18 (ribose-2'-O)-methylase SpoU
VLPAGDGPLTVLLCDGIGNVDNIGMLFRNAAALAVDAVVLSPTCHDPLYRKAVRVSIGHVLRVPWARSRAWADDLDRLGRDWGLTLIGAATAARARPLDEIERPLRVGVVVGQEHDGLSPEALQRCGELARIPMAEGVDSLNVAVAAALCLHRFSRGRRA